MLGRLTTAHTADACPLRKLRYCGICATYGHNQYNCPDEAAMLHREPLYLEQLIPAAISIEYSISSRTPLATAQALQINTKCIMEVPENEEAIRAALVAAGEKPMICQQKGRTEKKEIIENKKRLQKVADLYGRKLVFLREKGEAAPTKKK